jgi:undecaprenyl-diphosphatase
LAAVTDLPVVQRSIPKAVGEQLIADQAPSRARKRVGETPHEALNRPLLMVAVLAALGVAIVTAMVVMHPYLPEDALIERDVQSTNWGPLALTFPIFTWIGDAKGAVAEAIVFAGVLIFNRRAWRVPIGAAMTGVWYQVLSHLILRPRPTTAQVLQVTEHPGASSFPSGHTIFVATLMTVVMLCFGYRFLPRWARPAGWVLVAMTVVACAISRMDTGAHWPTDVLAAVLITIAWIAFVMSVRWISDGALTTDSR